MTLGLMNTPMLHVSGKQKPVVGKFHSLAVRKTNEAAKRLCEQMEYQIHKNVRTVF